MIIPLYDLFLVGNFENVLCVFLLFFFSDYLCSKLICACFLPHYDNVIIIILIITIRSNNNSNDNISIVF